MLCTHETIATDRITDTYVCTDCGLVMPERPSLSSACPAPSTKTLTHRASAYLVNCAHKLHVTARHTFAQAVDLAMTTGATLRHPGSLVACLVVASGVSIPSASKAMGLEARVVSRAVSRIRRRQKL